MEYGIKPVRSDGVLIGMTRGGHKLIVSLYVDGVVPAMFISSAVMQYRGILACTSSETGKRVLSGLISRSIQK